MIFVLYYDIFFTSKESFMNKIAIVTDSNSGITQSQAKELGIHVISMPFFANGQTYHDAYRFPYKSP